MQDYYYFFEDLVSYLGLLSSDAMDSETSLYIVDKTEVLASLLNADHIWFKKKKRKKSESWIPNHFPYWNLTLSDAENKWTPVSRHQSMSC